MKEYRAVSARERREVTAHYLASPHPPVALDMSWFMCASRVTNHILRNWRNSIVYQLKEQVLDRLLVALTVVRKQLDAMPAMLRAAALADPNIKELASAMDAIVEEIKPKPKAPITHPADTKDAPRVPWSAASGKVRCMWQGVHGRCIYDLGHFGNHAEETRDGIQDILTETPSK